ncbi:MAG: insulinase family protein, partial [Clostridiales bacterium]|nr:insulinase family protein [Clostridiales bacterium]
NLTKTIEIYEQAAEFIKNFDADERTITKYIIGALSDMDIPLNPSAKGSRSLGAYMSELDYEVVQKEREQVLFVTSQIINGLSTYLDAILKENYICVVGNEEKIQESKELFDNVENLFH